MPLVGMSGKIVRGNRGSRLGVLINDPINRFVGTVSNLWSNAANWSLGIIPTANQTAIIDADCTQNSTTATVKNLIVSSNYLLTTNIGTKLSIINNVVNYGILINNGDFTFTGNLETSFFGEFTALGDVKFYGAGGYLPSTISLYNNLYISKETKILSTNTITNTITVGSGVGVVTGTGGILDLNNFGLQVNAGAYVSNNDFGGSQKGGIIKLNDSSDLKFIGKLVIDNTLNNFSTVTENNIIEFRDGIRPSYISNQGSLLFGLSTLLFTTNNQSIESQNPTKNLISNFRFNILKVDNIELSLLDNGTVHVNKFEGIGLHKFVVDTNLYYYGDKVSPVLLEIIGKLFSYSASLNQEIFTLNYKELRLQGSGAKKLTGNTTCDHLYFAGTATLYENGYSLTGYTKYTDAGTVNRNLPSGNFDEIRITSTGSSVKTLTGNITCNLFDFTVGSSTVSVNYNGFSINALIFNDTFNTATHIGGVRDNILFLSFSGAPTVTLLSSLTINGILTVKPESSALSGSITMVDGSTALYDRQSPNQNLTSGIASYYNLTLTGTSGTTKTLVQNVVVRGTYTKGSGITLIKNGFTIKNGSGVDLE